MILPIQILHNLLHLDTSSNGQQTSFFTGSPGTFTVGSSEEELKETFLTTGIFQRKPGDSLDGRRSIKRFRREASLISHRRPEQQVQRSYGGGEEQSCQSVPSRQCRDTPRRQCQMNNSNCQMMPREVCRRVPRLVSRSSSLTDVTVPQEHLFLCSQTVLQELSQAVLSLSPQV